MRGAGISAQKPSSKQNQGSAGKSRGSRSAARGFSATSDFFLPAPVLGKPAPQNFHAAQGAPLEPGLLHCNCCDLLEKRCQPSNLLRPFLQLIAFLESLCGMQGAPPRAMRERRRLWCELHCQRTSHPAAESDFVMWQLVVLREVGEGGARSLPAPKRVSPISPRAAILRARRRCDLLPSCAGTDAADRNRGCSSNSPASKAGKMAPHTLQAQAKTRMRPVPACAEADVAGRQRCSSNFSSKQAGEMASRACSKHFLGSDLGSDSLAQLASAKHGKSSLPPPAVPSPPGCLGFG